MVVGEDNKPRIGLALSGGAARGIAHVGVLRALAEHNIRVDCIAGTSAGSLVGGALASGMPLSEIEDIGRTMRWRQVGRPTISRFGLQSNQRMEGYVRARFPLTRFEDLPIPLAVIATDLNSGEAVVMRDEGDVAFAIRASCTVPGWYVPVTDPQGRLLVDGGLVAIVPSAAARDLGADIVIAGDVNAEGAKFLGPLRSLFGVTLQSMMVVQRTVSLPLLEGADLVISPRVGHIRWDEMKRGEELLAAGYEAGLESIQAIKGLIASFDVETQDGDTGEKNDIRSVAPGLLSWRKSLQSRVSTSTSPIEGK
jgi:NTE family protein